MQDIIIKNGLLCNGSNRPPFQGDLAVKNGIISQIAPRINGPARETIDAEGLVVSPGFIDIHSHGDTSFLFDEKCESKIYQGVTTELAGQCGSTIYPHPTGGRENLLHDIGPAGNFDIDYFASASLKEFMDKCEQRNMKMATNIAPLTGHGALRAGVLGQAARPADEKELTQMKALLDNDMQAGAWGLSLGLGYSPGLNATQEELNQLGYIVSNYRGIITAHLRDQGVGIYGALDEMLEIHRAAGAKIHIAHLKLSGQKSWGGAASLYQYIKQAQKSGVPITADMYPYTAASSGITNSFPKWAIAGGTEKAVQRLKGPEREKIMAFLNENFRTKEDGERLLVVTTMGKFPIADGKTIWAISNELGLSMAETIEKITVETNSYATCISFTASEEDMLYLLGQDIAIGSDGAGLPFDPERNPGKPHPRNFAAFPRFLKLARTLGLCPIETAVYRMTKKSADIIGLQGRGQLREGYVADITIFDPDTVSDNNNFQNPFIKNTGIEYVVIGGVTALSQGVQTDARPGRFLLKKNYAYQNGIKICTPASVAQWG